MTVLLVAYHHLHKGCRWERHGVYWVHGKAKLLMNESGWAPGLLPLKKYWHLEFVKNVVLTDLICVIYMCDASYSPIFSLPYLPHSPYVFSSYWVYLCIPWSIYWDKYTPHALSPCWWNWIELHITMKFPVTWTKRWANRFFKKKGFIKHFFLYKTGAECH